MSPVLTLSNAHLAFELREDATMRITDVHRQVSWESMPRCFQEKGDVIEDVVWNRRERVWADVYVSSFTAVAEDAGVRVTVHGPAGESRGSFLLMVTLDEEWLTFRIEQIEERLQCLVFPTPIRSSSLIVPNEIGSWVKNEGNGMSSTLSMQNNGLNMRWIGGLADNDDDGYMMVFDEAFADSGVYRNGLAAAPIWAKSMGSWGTTRTVRYRCTTGGYVGMAKVYRAYAYERRIVRSLQEKIDACPPLGDLLGGRIVSMFQCSTVHKENAWNFFGQPSAEDVAADNTVDVRITHRDAAEIIALSKQWGMERGLFNLRGTFAGGYDDRHPDIWPPEPSLGTLEELKSITAQPRPFAASLHDNYQDMYPRTDSFPDGVVQTRAGQLMHGGHWHGGQCFIVCPTRQRAYAERNWAHVKELGLQAYFIDTAACVQFYQCFHPDHPMTRSEDIDAKLGLMGFFKEQGLVLGSENAADFGMYHLDFLENRHARLPGRSIPLWPLVFHDAAFYARYGTQGTSGGSPVSQLENMLWGYLSYFPANSLEDWKTREQAFRDSLEVDRWHARVGMDDMTSHRYLTEDFQVEQTEFSSGVSVIANFADEPRTVEGKTITANSHLILE